MSWQADGNEIWATISKRLQAAQALILAAHPDDETIGASQFLAWFPNSSVVFLTDGAPRDQRLWSAGQIGSREEYAGMRREEAVRALTHAGILSEQISWLGAVDQEAVLEIPHLTKGLLQILSDRRPAAIVTHPYEGGHPDHDAAAVVARIAVMLCKDEVRPLLLEMTSYHARDGRCVTGEFLTAEGGSEFVFALSDADGERKQRMMQEYASQRLVLENFPIHPERIRLAPEYDFARPPHEGKLWYECMGWPMTGPRWRELARAALEEFQECSCR